MKRLTSLILIVAMGLLMTTFAALRPVSAQTTYLNAYKGSPIPDTSIDGTIGTEWNDAGNYTDVPIDPDGQYAQVLTKHDGTYLYIAIKFDADSDDTWLALQLGTTGCMDSTADGVIFGDNNLVPDGYSDAYFQGPGPVAADGTQDGVGAMSVAPTQLITVELKKPLNSGDSSGNDIAWSEGNEYTLVIAWDSNGGGSSGGGTNHRSGTTPTAKTIFINPQAIPEFSGLMFIGVLIIASIPLAILLRRVVPKPKLIKKL